MFANIALWLGKSALMTSPVGSFLKAIPAKVWLYIAIAAALVGAFLWHQHHARAALQAKYAAGYAQALADVRAQAAKNKTKIDARTTAIAADERKKNDAENIRISRTADALRLRGPGKAECRLRAEPSAASGGHVEAADGGGNAAVHRLPAEDGSGLIGLPVSSAIGFAAQNDALIAEVKGWRSWYDRVLKVWPKAGDKPQ